jgi:DNA-binding response OmpR family regulator
VAKILLVEDDARVFEPLLRWLIKEGHTVEWVASGEDALQMLNVYKFDVVVLDWGLPGLSGLEVLKRFRRTGGITPVLFLTGKGDVASKKAGLDSGADDYLPKPFEADELSARIRALLRRPIGLLPRTLSIANISLELESKNVYLAGNPVRLGKKEYSILELLMRHPDRCFSSKELMEAIWPSDTDSTEDAVRSCVKQLRSKITTPDGKCVISTIPGAGYIISREKNDPNQESNQDYT